MPYYTIPQRLEHLRRKSAEEHAWQLPKETAAQRDARFLTLLRCERDKMEAEIADKQKLLAMLKNLIISYEIGKRHAIEFAQSIIDETK